ncbi:MAG: hypothetical protein NTW28_24665, partial [Candidatus Solibacter sp.]|nr:hypothetical protein [Candidatus Solibacter sp.]
RVTLQGDDWQIGVVENPFVKAGAVSRSHVLLRPWEERQRPFNPYESSLHAFPNGPKLFVGQRTYEFQATATSTGGAEVLRMQLTAQQPVLGELKITGEFIGRLILAGGPSLVVLDRPGAVIRVPVSSMARSRPRTAISPDRRRPRKSPSARPAPRFWWLADR